MNTQFKKRELHDRREMGILSIRAEQKKLAELWWTDERDVSYFSRRPLRVALRMTPSLDLSTSFVSSAPVATGKYWNQRWKKWDKSSRASLNKFTQSYRGRGGDSVDFNYREPQSQTPRHAAGCHEAVNFWSPNVAIPKSAGSQADPYSPYPYKK